MEAQEYEKLVKALRNCSGQGFLTCRECQYNNNMLSCAYKMMLDAAAAIEELQAEVKELKRVNMEIFEDLPKLGKWTEIEDYDGDFHYQCSVCGEEWYFIDGTPTDNNANYCPRCGAKMEVQE